MTGTYWKPFRYDLCDETAKVVASVSRESDDGWSWHLTGENTSGAEKTITAAMNAVERLLKVNPGLFVSAAEIPQTQDEAAYNMNKLMNAVAKACAEEAAVAMAFAALIPSKEGKDAIVANAQFPTVTWSGEETAEDALKLLKNLRDTFTRMLGESQEKAISQAMMQSLEKAGVKVDSTDDVAEAADAAE